MSRRRSHHLRLESLESRDNPSLVLLPDATLASLRQEAAAQTPKWLAFRARLDANLAEIVSYGDYQGAALAWIGDYALGYQVLKASDPTTASRYADKALAVMKSGLHDVQRTESVTRQFLARGDGTTQTFALPHSDILPASFRVYLAAVQVMPVVRGAANTQDEVEYYHRFLKVSTTANGPAAYAEGPDWRHNPDYENHLIDWSATGSEPAPGSTYYVTLTSGMEASQVGAGQYTFDGTSVRFNTAPAANRAIFVEYIYGANAPAGAGQAFQQTSAGDGGFNSILINVTYPSRYLGKYLALGYDWLSDYNGYASALRAETAGLLVRWSDFVRDFGYYADSPASNYGAGGYVSRMLTAAALANQGHPAAGRLLAEMSAYHQDHLVPALQSPDASLKGGFWSEGWNYGELSAQNLLLAGLAYEQAGLGAAAAERQWATEVIRHLVAAQPTPATIYNGGDWYTHPAPFVSKEPVYLLAALTPDATARGYANHIIQNYPGPQAANAIDLLFRDPAAPTGYWAAEPLQHFAAGTGLVTARADWTYNSTWVSVQLGNLLAADHQSYAPGQLQIQRGGDALLENGPVVLGVQTGVQQSSYGNIVVLDDNGDGLQTYRFSTGDWYGSPGVRITAYQPADGFVYVAGDYRAAYSGADDPGGGGPATELTRQVIYLRPDFVIVHDRVGTVKASYPKELRWHLTEAPNVSGNSWVETVGSSKLFGRTFSSQPLTTTVTSLDGGTAYRVTTKNANPVSTVRYVTAFQTAPSSAAAMVATQRVTTADGRMEGVQMGDQVALFGTNGTVNLSAPVSYSVTGAQALTHLLTDLSPGAGYQIVADGQPVGTRTASAQGTITFTTPAGAQAVIVSVTSAVPVANPDAYTVLHDRPLQVSQPTGLLANDQSPNGGALTAGLVSGPSHGALQLNADGSFTYTPAAGFVGTDTFTYVAADGAASSVAATVAIAVRNAAPSATADGYTVAFNEPAAIPAATGLLANDTDADGDPLTAALVGGPAHGAVQLNANGSFTYTPAAGFVGTDTFTYRASDGPANTAPTTVTLTVQGPAPTTNPDSYSVRHDRRLVVPRATGVLANDVSPSGRPLKAVLVTRPSNGRLTLYPLGAFVYLPKARFSGTDTFTYRTTDGVTTSAPTTVTITVRDSAPVAAGDAYRVPADGPTTVFGRLGLLANDTDADADRLSAVLVSPPAHGRLLLYAGGGFTYTPEPGYVGPDGFEYRAHTGTLDSPPARVDLTVLARPRVDAVSVNGGSAQRSRVLSVALTFDMLVALDSGAVVVMRSDGTVPRQTRTVSEAGGRTTVVITFAGPGTQAGSLADGRWSVRVAAARVHRADHAGTTLAAGRIDPLHRWFGDVDGDRDTDDSDRTAFLAALGQSDPTSLAAFDADGDGDVDAADQLVFDRHFGKRI